MSGIVGRMDVDLELNVLESIPGLQIYTQISLCFPVTDPSSYQGIINTLTTGLAQLSTGFPWIAGQLVNQGASEGITGTFHIKPLGKSPPFVTKDLRDEPTTPSMFDLRRANFPFSLLDEGYLAPRRTLPGNPDEAHLTNKPVFPIQATLITGGLLLTIAGSHNVMDMTGQARMMHLLAKACRGEPFTEEELAIGNMARKDMIPLLDSSYEPGPELESQLVKAVLHPATSGDVPGPSSDPPPQASWEYFTFSASSLAELKLLATRSITLPEGGFISTDDALSAFIWQSVIRARLPRLSPSAESTFARAVDARRYIGTPLTYPGLLQTMSYNTCAMQKLTAEPLGSIASQLRSTVDPKTSDVGFRTKALATVLSRSLDKNAVSFTAKIDVSKDLMLSSWAKLDCYDLDFGPGLGRPESVRRPGFVPYEGLLYLMPKRLDGEIALAVCLREEDMVRLRADKQFERHAEYIG